MILLKSKPKFMKRIYLLFVGFIIALRLFAVPATPEVIRMTQPDGSKISVRLVGDEYFSMFISLDGYPLLRSEDGFFYYAQPIENSDFILSPYRATEQIASNPQLASMLYDIDKRKVGEYLLGKIEERKKNQKSQPLDYLQKNSVQELATEGRHLIPTNSNQQVQRIANKKDFNGLVLVVEFPDQKLNEKYPFSTFDQIANQEGYNDYGFTGSVRDYFYDQSYGQFNPSFDVVGPIMLPQKMGYYGADDPTTGSNNKNMPELVVTACQIANSQFGTDFSKYDQDDDGYVDMVYIIFAGYSQAQGGPEESIWPHASNVRYTQGENSFDNKIIGTYACSSELAYSRGDYIDGLGTLVHEFSHILGLVDVYDVSYSGYYGMGSWDLMSGGSYNNGSKTPAGYSAYERQMVGWMELKELGEDPVEKMDYIGNTPQAYTVTNPQNTNELFTIENRQPIKWDSYLPASGIMILHINYEPVSWSMNQVNTTPIQGYTIVAADNKLSINNQENDLYPNALGNASFSRYSTPSSRFYDGTYADIELNNISNDGQDMRFNFVEQRPQTPDNIRFDNISKSGMTVSWDEAPNCTSYEVRSQARYSDPVLLNENFSKMTAGSVSSPDTKDISPVLNQYVESDELLGNNIFQAGGACAIGTDREEGILVSPLVKYLGSDYTPTISFDVVKSKNKESDNLLLFSYDQNLTRVFGYIAFREGTGTFRFQDPAWTSRNLYLALVGSKSFIIDNLNITYDGTDIPNYSDEWQGEKGVISTSTYIPSLEPLTEYTVQVRGIKDGSVSEWSEPQFVSTNNSEPEGSGIEDIQDQEPNVYSMGENLVVELKRDCMLTISNLMGQVVYKASHPKSILTIKIDKGIYVLNDGNKTYKISH